MTYRIWNNDHWHFQLLSNVASEHRKKVLEFRTFEDAVTQIMKDNLAGSEIWQQVGIPEVSIRRLDPTSVAVNNAVKQIKPMPF
jgi:hypothetical protein